MSDDNDAFLKRLSDLFAKKEGTVWLTHKRLTHDGDDAAMKHEDGSADTREYACLLRVTDGKGTKFSTEIHSSELLKFQAHYGSLLKSSMTSLRKRDRKREKQHAEEAAKRKSKRTDAVKIDGSKRGNGRRRRQRQVKALLKQQESQKRLKEREEAGRKVAEGIV